MDYRVGSVIEYQTRTSAGDIRRVLVNEKDENIKNGDPGFGGTIVAGRPYDVEYDVWGYDYQITRVVTF